MSDRIILHCDLNNFFASVSLLLNPTLYNLPVAVCGDKEKRHGIVLAKNEIAKSYGVKTAEAIFEAQAKCPDLVILPPDMEKYREYSEAAKKIYSRYTDMTEPFGIDECWLDVTGSTLLFGDGETIANRIRRDMKRELGLTVSVGVSFNKIFAKLGSDMKKPDAVTVITRENFREKVWPLPVSDLLFVGKKSYERLKSSGIYTIGDLTHCSDSMLNRLLGKNGIQLKQYALGEDNSPVERLDSVHIPKSVGRSVTEATDFTDCTGVWRTFLSLSEEISDSLRQYGLYAGGIQVHIRTSSLAVKEFSRSLKNPTDSSLIIAQKGMDLFKENFNFNQPLRSVGIRAINLKSADTAVQQDIFGDFENQKRLEQIESSVYEIRRKFGGDSIKRGGTF